MAFKLNLGTLGVGLKLDTRSFDRGLSKARKMLGGMAKAGAAAAAALAAGLAAGSVAAVKEFAEVEQAVMNAAAVTREGAGAFDAFLESAFAASSGTVFSAKEAGDGLKYLAMAGFEAGEAVEALPGVLNLAQATSTDLGRAADIASDTLTGMGLKVEDLARVNDVLVKTVTSSNTNLKQLGLTMSYVGPIAKSMEVKIEEVAAAAGLLGNAALKGEKGGTKLRQMFVALVRPTKASRDAMKALNTTFDDGEGGIRSLVDIIADLEEAQKGMGKLEFRGQVAKLFGSEALPGVLTLVEQGSAKFNQFKKDLEAAGGTAERVATLMQSTVSAQFRILQGNVSNLSAKLGQVLAPALRAVNESLTEQVTSILKNDAAFNRFRDGAAAVVKAAGGIVKILARVAGGGARVVGVMGELANIVRLVAADVYAQIRSLQALGEIQQGVMREGLDFFDSQRYEDITRETKAARQEVRRYASQIGEANQQAKHLQGELEALGDVVGDTFIEGGLAIEELTRKQANSLAAAQKLGEEYKASAKAGQSATKKAAEGAGALNAVLETTGGLVGHVASQLSALHETVKSGNVEMIRGSLEAARALGQVADEMERAQKSGGSMFGGMGKGIEQGVKDAQKQVAKQRADALREAEKQNRAVAEEAAAVGQSILGMLSGLAGFFDGPVSTYVQGLMAGLDGILSNLTDPIEAALSGFSGYVSSLMRIVQDSENAQASLDVLGQQLRRMAGFGEGFDLAEEYFKVFDPLLGLAEVVAGNDAVATMVAGYFEDIAGGIFKVSKILLTAIQGTLVAMSIARIGFLEVKHGLLRFVIEAVRIIESLVQTVFKRFSIALDDELMANLVRTGIELEGLREQAKNQADAFAELQDMTFEEAKAAGAKAREEAKAAENLKELNDQLKNAPSGFQRTLNALRAGMETGDTEEFTRRRQGQQLAGRDNSRRGTVIYNLYFQGSQVDPDSLVEAMQRKKLVQNGGYTASRSQRYTEAITTYLAG